MVTVEAPVKADAPKSGSRFNESNQIRLEQMNSPLALSAKASKELDEIYKIAKPILDIMPDFKAAQKDGMKEANNSMLDARNKRDAAEKRTKKETGANLDVAEEALAKAEEKYSEAKARSEFWENVSSVEKYLNKINSAIEEGGKKGTEEMKKYREKYGKISISDWVDGLSSIVKKEAKEFGSLKLDDAKPEELKLALEEFQAISKHATSSTTLTALWYRVGKETGFGTNQDDAIKKVSCFLTKSKEGERSIYNIVQKLSEEYTISRLAADTRKLINQNKDNRGYIEALAWLEHADSKQYTIQIKSTATIIEGRVSYAWIIDTNAYWRNIKRKHAPKDTEAADIELKLDYLNKKKNMSAAIDAWKAINALWISKTDSITKDKDQTDDKKRESLIMKCNEIKTLDDLHKVWREVVANSYRALEDEIRAAEPKEFETIFRFLESQRLEFSGNDSRWVSIEELFKKFREKTSIRRPLPTP